MYTVEFYENDRGVSELWDFLEELRPGNNRVFYFCWRGDRFVLLHQFRKRSQKTPRREIERAKAERDDWLARKGE